MNYYNITKKDQQYYNCLYCLNHFKPSRITIKDNSITIKDDITWYLTKELYESINDIIDRNRFNSCYRSNK